MTEYADSDHGEYDLHESSYQHEQAWREAEAAGRCMNCWGGPFPGAVWDSSHPTEHRITTCPECHGCGRITPNTHPLEISGDAPLIDSAVLRIIYSANNEISTKEVPNDGR